MTAMRVPTCSSVTPAGSDCAAGYIYGTVYILMGGWLMAAAVASCLASSLAGSVGVGLTGLALIVMRTIVLFSTILKSLIVFASSSMILPDAINF